MDAEDDLSTKGVYPIPVTCGITRPNDYTNGVNGFMQAEGTFTWTLTVVDPCEEANLCEEADCDMTDMEAYILKGAVSSTYTEKWDDVSKVKGEGPRSARDGYEFCGARTCTHSPTYSWLTHDDVTNTITVFSNSNGDDGVFDITFTCSLVDYPTRTATYI